MNAQRRRLFGFLGAGAVLASGKVRAAPPAPAPVVAKREPIRFSAMDPDYVSKLNELAQQQAEDHDVLIRHITARVSQ